MQVCPASSYQDDRFGRTSKKGFIPVTQGIIVFATFAIIVFNLIVDLLYAVIDPRIRLS